MTKFLNISTDNTLGGSSASDETVSSQKAIKEYVDNHGGGGAQSLSDIAEAGTGISFSGGGYQTDYTVGGSPTISSDYIASGFSTSNWIYKDISQSSVTDFEFIIKVNQSSYASHSDVVNSRTADKPVGFDYSGHLGIFNGSDWQYGSTVYSTGVNTWVMLKYSEGSYKVYGLIDNNYTIDSLPALSSWNLETTWTTSLSTYLDSYLDLGANRTATQEYFRGTIDLTGTYLRINGTEVWRAVGESLKTYINCTLTGVPSMSGQSGKFLTTDGTNASWAEVDTDIKLSDIAEAGNGISFSGGGTPTTDYSVSGSPTIDSNYVVSNFYSNRYVYKDFDISSPTEFEIVTKVVFDNVNTHSIFCHSGSKSPVAIDTSGRLEEWNGSSYTRGSTTYSMNQALWIKLRYSSGQNTVYGLVDNGYTISTLPPTSSWNQEFSISSNPDFLSGRLVFGANVDNSSEYLQGYLYLEDTYVSVDGVEVWRAVEESSKVSINCNIASSVDSSSTNSQAVGAKLFYDTCGDIETLINAL